MSRMRIADVNEKAERNAERLQRFEKLQKVWNGVLISAAVLAIVLHFCT